MTSDNDKICNYTKIIGFLLESLIKDVKENSLSPYNELFIEKHEMIIFLFSKIKGKPLCGNCKGCLDTSYYAECIISYIHDTEEQYQKYYSARDVIFESILDEYNRDEALNIIDEIESGLLGNNVNINNYFKESKKVSLINNNFSIMESCMKEMKKVRKSLIKMYLTWKITTMNDVVLSNIYSKLKYREKADRLVEIENDVSIFYLDQNIVSLYDSNSSYRKKIDKFKKNTNSMFIYSPFHLEDAIKMDKSYLNDYLISLKRLTDGYISLMNDENKLCIVKEDPLYSLKRVQLFLKATKAAETKRVYLFELDELDFSEMRTIEHKKIINNGISEYFNFDSIEIDKLNEDEQKRYKNIETAFNRANLASKHFTIKDYFNCEINYENDMEMNQIIETIFRIFDIIAFKIESPKEIKKIKSSLQDIEHIKHARVADYFVTNDKKLYERTKEIYYRLKIKTNVLLKKDFDRRLDNEN